MSGGAADGARIDGLFELAFRRHQAGQLQEAERLYRSILAADPRQLDCLNFLGMIALQSGRPQEAAELVGQALAANDRVAAWHGTIAEAHRMLGDRDAALDHCAKAVALDPRYAAAHHMRAALLLEAGRASEATDAAWRALAASDGEPLRALFVQCVRSSLTLPGDPGFRQVLTRAVIEGWGRPVELAGAALRLVRTDAAIRTAIATIDTVWPRRLDPSRLAPAMTPLMLDPLLHRVMETTPVSDEGIERLLSCARTLLLDAALDPAGDIAPEMLAFACALGRQCHINDYAFHLPDVERDGMVALRGKLLTELGGKAPVLAITLISYATYAPLATLDRTSAILARPWPDAMRGLLQQQLREPEEEARLRAAMPRLTRITDDTSIRVRQPYEDNPCPRWVQAAPVQPAAGIAAWLRGAFPFAPLQPRQDPATPHILVAGCGTGEQAADAARRFPNGRVTAIDLSLASLAYAQRKAAELKLTNVAFGQADILAFAPEQRFDLIEASGVLHQLADPLSGWSRLATLLAPGGFMRLGLAGTRVHPSIALAREFVANGGYDTSSDSIRFCRQNLVKLGDKGLRAVLGSPDFYSLGACRALLFPVQERGVSLPEIAAFLADHRLTLLGFELDPSQVAKYRARFPEDAAMTDLAQWQIFESENPDAFGGAYAFWIQKAAQ